MDERESSAAGAAPFEPDAKPSPALNITPARLSWLRHLETHGETPWSLMPRKAAGNASITNKTWRPMIAAGLITGEYKRAYYTADWYFAITDAGRAALKRATPEE